MVSTRLAKSFGFPHNFFVVGFLNKRRLPAVELSFGQVDHPELA